MKKKILNKPKTNEIQDTNKIITNEKDRTVRWEIIVSMITSVTAIISVFIAIITVCQMKSDRDAAYRPKILINPAQCEFSWDENGKSDWMDSMKNLGVQKDSEESNDILQEGVVTSSIGVLLDTVNVGVGTANHIYFEWLESNITKLNEYLIQCDSSKTDFMEIDESIKLIYDDKILGLNLPSTSAQMYMLPMAEESYSLLFPPAYYLLIQEIIKAGGNQDDIPYIILSANYTDIQGKEYTDVFVFAVKITLRVEDTSGSGTASFQLVPLFEAR